MIDKIVVICCALCNFCDPVVPLSFLNFNHEQGKQIIITTNKNFILQ